MDVDKQLKDGFDWAANRPGAWRTTAANLTTAADLLARDCRLDLGQALAERDVDGAVRTFQRLGPLLLLRGCAVECLLKAHFVRTGGVLARGGRYVRPRGAKDHDLVSLATIAHVDVSEAEQRVLSKLSDWIVRGRYPLLLDARQQFWGRLDRPPAWSEELEAAYKQLAGRLDATLEDVAG
jgi:hypothetical protein